MPLYTNSRERQHSPAFKHSVSLGCNLNDFASGITLESGLTFSVLCVVTDETHKHPYHTAHWKYLQCVFFLPFLVNGIDFFF